MHDPIKKLCEGGKIAVRVPASKSILNRALLLAAFSDGDTFLNAGPLCDDTQTMVRCLMQLGYDIEQTAEGFLIHGNRAIPNRHADLDVGSAGTVARFLTATLAFLGGDYRFFASEQMMRRPMDVLPVLAGAGADIRFLGEKETFPFSMYSEGIGRGKFCVDTSVSSQFASGLMLGAALSAGGEILLTGESRKSYPEMTIRMIDCFGGKAYRAGDRIEISPIAAETASYFVEADLSSACYFYALALLLKKIVVVNGVPASVLTGGTLQGDVRFLEVLRQRGVRFSEQDGDLVADGSQVTHYPGFRLDVREFADQAITLAALAPFADDTTTLSGISHLRSQECDRVEAIVHNLTALGVPCLVRGDAITIEPHPGVKGGLIQTYGDHRVAMGFSLIGTRTGNLFLDDASCCRKTFGAFFDILSKLS